MIHVKHELIVSTGYRVSAPGEDKEFRVYALNFNDAANNQLAVRLVGAKGEEYMIGFLSKEEVRRLGRAV